MIMFSPEMRNSFDFGSVNFWLLFGHPCLSRSFITPWFFLCSEGCFFKDSSPMYKDFTLSRLLLYEDFQGPAVLSWGSLAPWLGHSFFFFFLSHWSIIALQSVRFCSPRKWISSFKHVPPPVWASLPVPIPAIWVITEHSSPYLSLEDHRFSAVLVSADRSMKQLHVSPRSWNSFPPLTPLWANRAACWSLCVT